MTSPALDLLLRVVGAQLENARCAGCGTDLSGAPVAVLEPRDDSIVVELTCRACLEKVRLQVTPESDAGVAGVG